MKAIKDCEYKVWLHETTYTEKWYWIAQAIRPYMAGQSAISFDSLSLGYFRKKQSVKRNWEKFAKLNKIRKWKYV